MNCCGSDSEKDTISFLVTNTGDEDKTFRLFGGGTGLSTVDDNNYVLSSGFIPVNQGPTNITYNSDLNYIYVLNNSPLFPAIKPTISVIDSDTNQVVDTINLPLATSIFNSVYVSFNKTLYVSDLGSNLVFAVNTLTGAVSLITVGNAPFALVYADDLQKLYITNSSDGTVSIINVNTNLVLASPVVGTNPQNLAYASSSGQVYVINFDDGTISVIANSNLVVATINIGLVGGVTASGIIYVSELDRVYTTNSGNNRVYVINPATDTVITSVLVGDTPTILSYNSFQNLIYCGNNVDYTISVINSLNAVESQIPLTSSMLGNSIFLVFNTTDQYLYVSLGFSNVIQVFDTNNSNALINTYSAGIDNPFNIIFNNQNSVYAVNYGQDNVFYLNTAQSVSVIVNGGSSTIEEINNDTLVKPICICSLDLIASEKAIFNNLLNKDHKSSSGDVQRDQISLLARYTAFNKQNVVNLTGDDFTSCVLDGDNYLEWIVPVNSNVSINVSYCQYDRSPKMPFIIKKWAKNKKKYIHGRFKYWLN